MNTTLFQQIMLDEAHSIWIGQLPIEISDAFDLTTVWNIHPNDFHKVEIFGKEIPTPRWQQAYGANYRYTGAVQNALPISPEMLPFQQWCQKEIDIELNGLLINWYDGSLKHYIGAHKDDTRDLKAGHPIVSISLGEERVFRMRPWKKKGHQDFIMPHGSLVIIPWETNLSWTHEVPHFAKYREKRISITLRAFS